MNDGYLNFLSNNQIKKKKHFQRPQYSHLLCLFEKKAHSKL